jgi:hypothetical protein
MEAVMRIRRTILAPVILAIGTVGALVGVPALTVAAPTAAATPGYMIYHASGVSPDLMVFHASGISPDLMVYH